MQFTLIEHGQVKPKTSQGTVDANKAMEDVAGWLGFPNDNSLDILGTYLTALGREGKNIFKRAPKEDA